MSVLTSSVLAISDVHTGDGWYGVVLAVLNVGQTLALAYMAGRSRRIRRRVDTSESAGAAARPSGRRAGGSSSSSSSSSSDAPATSAFERRPSKRRL